MIARPIRPVRAALQPSTPLTPADRQLLMLGAVLIVPTGALIGAVFGGPAGAVAALAASVTWTTVVFDG